ncbi:LOW QUALITY PROTEIN: solute carrier family 22 member 13-like [Phycodurus eques]|uniref:LOW QUALITY PROTEIN: solute carrier family 22 member 13-like n=1 Tax=Phycodurus eques TaxID=693459 RepID=UPI002ACD3193|nr:LOW QUALITY PROTEIN: solute carrier family 22 member 13-like [Phycodurus eques]
MNLVEFNQFKLNSELHVSRFDLITWLSTVLELLNTATFGDSLKDIGEFGIFQKLIVCALGVPNIILGFEFACVFFIQSDPERHRNTDWILEADANLTSDEQLNLTVPRERDGSFSRCRMFAPVDWDIGTIRGGGGINETTACRNGWVYSSSLYTATIVTDFDLVCERANLREVAQTVMMSGILLGCLLFGPFGESYGRKRAVPIALVVVLILTVTTALSPNYPLYLLSQFLMGLGCGGFRRNGITLGKTLANSGIGASNRSWGACATQICGAVGQAILAGLIYVVREWRVAQLITAALLLAIAISIWFVPESARWLLDRGRTEEAKELLFKVAAINKRRFSDTLLEKVRLTATIRLCNYHCILILIQSSVLRKYFLAILFTWFSLNVALYCISFNVGNFGSDIFLTQFIFGLTEIPAHLLCIWQLEALGRRISFISTLLIGGSVCMLMLIFKQGNPVAFTALATSGRFVINWASTICNVYVQELFPTSCRPTASGLGSVASRAGGLIAPVVNMLATYHWSIPIISFSGLTLVSGSLCFLLPETRGIELPDSIDEAESIRNKKTTNKENNSNIIQMKSSKL